MSKQPSKLPPVTSLSSEPTKQITIDGNSYNLDNLSADAKQQLINLKSVDQELAKLKCQRAIANLARSAYANAVSAALPKTPTQPSDGARSAVINGVTYDWGSLGERVQGLLTGIQAADRELARVHAQTQLAQTARGIVAQGVNQSLPRP